MAAGCPLRLPSPLPSPRRCNNASCSAAGEGGREGGRGERFRPSFDRAPRISAAAANLFHLGTPGRPSSSFVEGAPREGNFVSRRRRAEGEGQLSNGVFDPRVQRVRREASSGRRTGVESGGRRIDTALGSLHRTAAPQWTALSSHFSPKLPISGLKVTPKIFVPARSRRNLPFLSVSLDGDSHARRVDRGNRGERFEKGKRWKDV